MFELSNEGISRFEFEQPISTSLPLDEQLALALKYYRYAEANATFLEQMGFSSFEELQEATLSDFHGDNEQNYEVNRLILEHGSIRTHIPHFNFHDRHLGSFVIHLPNKYASKRRNQNSLKTTIETSN